MILDEFFKSKSTAVLAEDNLQGTSPDDEVKFFIDSEPAYYAVMDRFGDHIDFRGDDMIAPQRLWSAIQQTAGDAGGAADIAGLEDDRMGTDDELDEQDVTENYPKHQDLSGISTDKLKAYVAKYTSHPMSGEGAQVRRVRAELERREESNFGNIDDEEENQWWIDHDVKEGMAEGLDDKIAKHNAAVAKMTKRTFAKLDYSHPDLLKRAPKGYAFDITHKISPYEKDVSEAHNFKGSFPFDLDHMGGTRGINLPSAPTKKFFTDKKQWTQTVDDINSSKYDDNSEYTGTTGRTTVSIDGREWARWSDAQEKGYIEMSSMTERDVSEAHGNYAGDQPVNLGGVSMKKIQIGDTVRYIDQKAQVVDMSQDREHARITIPSSATTKTVLTSDLRQLGRGVSEETLSELSPATLASYKTKAGAAATAADSTGDRKTGDRRFSGIVKATKKQFDQDAKQSAQAVHESRLRLMASIIKTQ